MNKCIERLYNGIIKENPTFVLILGMCPTLAVTSSLVNGAGMGLSTMAVLVLSNMVISMLRNIIPNGVRVPAFIVIVASFVTILQFLLEAYLPSLNSALGIYIPLIVVNCIIFGRAESFAGKNPGLLSLFDGIGMGLGFTGAITIIGLVRELLGAGTFFGIEVLTKIGYTPASIFIMAPGAFFVLSVLTALQNKLKAPSATNVEGSGCDQIACGGNCSTCGGSVFVSNKGMIEKAKAEADAKAAAEKAAKAAAAKAAKEAASKEEE